MAKPRQDYKFELIQDGMTVATVIASGRKEGRREIEHYAMQYGQDGPVEIKESRIWS